jgi:glutamate formiminotransferase / 5-formyltetrahydrofolate cyclo-ligase
LIVEAVPNFSEGRDDALVAALGEVAASGCYLLDVHPDPIHNRTVVSVAATSLDDLVDGLLGGVALARRRIDLRRHAGVHPRVGAADVVPLVPLEGATMEQCVGAAHRLGERIWSELQVPVYFYGAAARRPEAVALSRIRAGADPPDLGSQLHPTAGAVSVGARPPLLAYNLVLPNATPQAARQLAAAIRESSGGLPGVQALAFDLGGGLRQLSMNLVRLDATTPGTVLARARELAGELGIEIGPEEVVGLCPAAHADTAAADGRLLEARLAAAGARDGAAECRRRGGRELGLLAAKLEERATSLAELGTGGDGLLRGAEEAAALPRVLERAGALTPAAAELLGYASRTLRAAVSPEVARDHAARVEALDAWLR